jgi:hypothetical protein
LLDDASEQASESDLSARSAKVQKEKREKRKGTTFPIIPSSGVDAAARFYVVSQAKVTADGSAKNYFGVQDTYLTHALLL